MALTILLTSTGSSAPLRFLTRITAAPGCTCAAEASVDLAVSRNVGAAWSFASPRAGPCVGPCVASSITVTGFSCRVVAFVVVVSGSVDANVLRPPDVVVMPHVRRPLAPHVVAAGSVITAVKLRWCQPSRAESVNLPAQRPYVGSVGRRPVRPAGAVSPTPRRPIRRWRGRNRRRVPEAPLAFGFGVPDLLDLQEPTVTTTHVVLAEVERGAPTGAFEFSAICLLEDRAVLALAQQPLAGRRKSSGRPWGPS